MIIDNIFSPSIYITLRLELQDESMVIECDEVRTYLLDVETQEYLTN